MPIVTFPLVPGYPSRYAIDRMTNNDLFNKIGDAYLSLVHLGAGVDAAVEKISHVAETFSSQSIGELLRDGDSWRERLTGLVMASLDGIESHYDDLIRALHSTGGISIVPISAATSVAIRDLACRYDPQMTASLDRDAWDGEIGFAIDWLHYAVGIGVAPSEEYSPNYGQHFRRHRSFYENLKRA